MTAMVAVATLDPDQAAVAEDALVDAGIAVELKALAAGPFLLVQAGERMFEVRVPPERLADADDVLRQMAVASQEALVGVVPADPASDEARAAAALREAEPPARHKSPALGALYALLLPCVGPIYAGSPVLALASLFIHVVPLYAFFAHGDRSAALVLWAVGRVLDVVGTLVQIARHNQLLEKESEHGAQP